MSTAKASLLDKMAEQIERLNQRFTPLARWFERHDMPQTARLAQYASAFFLAYAAFMSAPFGIVFASMYGAAAGIGLALALPPIGTAFYLAVFGTQERIDNFFDKRRTQTVTNLAGQTVQGSAYDIKRLQKYEAQIDRLSRAAGNPLIRPQEETQALLKTAFAKAAPHAARVTVIADPEAAEGAPSAYAFAQKDTVTQTTVKRLSA